METAITIRPWYERVGIILDPLGFSEPEPAKATASGWSQQDMALLGAEIERGWDEVARG